MTGPYPRNEHAIPFVVPTTIEEIVEVARKNGVSPSGFCEHCRPAFGKDRPYGSVEDWKNGSSVEGELLMVGMCRAWIRCFGRNKNVSKVNTSYGFKHEVERHFNHYIGNGSFIVAGYLEGLIVSRTSPGSPNAYFNLSRRDLRNAAQLLRPITQG